MGKRCRETTSHGRHRHTTARELERSDLERTGSGNALGCTFEYAKYFPKSARQAEIEDFAENRSQCKVQLLNTSAYLF